jgi:hypothetical protein
VPQGRTNLQRPAAAFAHSTQPEIREKMLGVNPIAKNQNMICAGTDSFPVNKRERTRRATAQSTPATPPPEGAVFVIEPR